MKKVIFFLMFWLMISACRNDQSEFVRNTLAVDEFIDTTEYPLIIDGGKKIVYQHGHMTPDKGLKLYLDTIAHPAAGFYIDDSVRNHLSARNADR